MEIRRPGRLGGPGSIRRIGISHVRGTDGAQAVNLGDIVEISQIAIYLEKLSHVPDIRVEKVDPVKAEIERGTYETEERIDRAVDNLMAEI